MKFRDLREYIAFLEQKGELRRISAPVDPRLEITEIADRVIKSGGPALLFENPQGYDIPVVINLYGSAQRTAWALGVDDLDEVAGRVQGILNLVQAPPRDWSASSEPWGSWSTWPHTGPGRSTTRPVRTWCLRART